MRRPTLETVAAHAGVSRATVSRVVNGSPKVSDEVRARVEAAARELGYVPDTAARTLVTNRSGTVAIVVCEPDSRAFSDPWFGEVTRGIRAELTTAGLNLVVLIAPDAADQERCAGYLRGARVDGALLLSPHERHPLPRLLARAGLPTVLLGRPPDSAGPLPYVDIDNARSAEAAVRWLRHRGRTRIGIIAGPQDMPAARDRLDGYRAALGADYRPSRVEIGDYTRHHGRRAMAALLDRVPDLDAVFVPSDTMALGAQRAIRGTGRRTPDDIAVVGFDDIEALSADGDPPLTTVHQPVVDMGRELVRTLLRRPVEPTIFPTRLVVRESA
jgi:DNA-binding LacI/PurR family transcriptional regulator